MYAGYIAGYMLRLLCLYGGLPARHREGDGFRDRGGWSYMTVVFSVPNLTQPHLQTQHFRGELGVSLEALGHSVQGSMAAIEMRLLRGTK